MTVENWIGNNFKHDIPENSKIDGKYREDRSKHWQVYERWLDMDKDVDGLWLDYEQGCSWELFSRLPASVATRELVIPICEEIMEHFNLEREKEEYWWVEKDGKNKTSNDHHGWHSCLGILLHMTGIRSTGKVFHKAHPDFWNIVWKHIPKISELITHKNIIQKTIDETKTEMESNNGRMD